MRFIFGAPPIEAGFDPEQESGWRRLRELGPRTLVVLGSLVGVPLAILVGYGWSKIPGAQASAQFDITPFGRWGTILLALGFLLALAGFFFSLIFVHEFVHVLACPRFGLTSDTVMGVWPSRFMAYGNHSGPVACRRFMLVGAAPFLVLSVLPLLLAWAGAPFGGLLSIISTMNAMLCGGDALICMMLLHQVPLRATVRNKGWDTWWRPLETGTTA
ncbi:MAG: DUF3267 domain-containing protein [Planctomycetota bacterium]|nr:DUF3267 domain-containing protein [Planctomycetota bacterium]